MESCVLHPESVRHEGLQGLISSDPQSQQESQCGVDAVDGLADVWQTLPELRGNLTLHAHIQWCLQSVSTSAQLFVKILLTISVLTIVWDAFLAQNIIM